MERWQSLEPERRELLLRAALSEFGERGWDGASMQRIADGAHLSKGLLYYYFSGRETLFAWCLLQFLDELERSHGGWPALDDPITFWDDLLAFWDRVALLAQSRPELLSAARSFLRDLRMLDMGEAFAPLKERVDMFQARIIRQGQRLGLVRADLPIDLLMQSMSALDEAIEQWAFFGLTQDVARLRQGNRYRVDLMRRILSPAPAT